jgi:hypothetical protein
MHAFLSRLIGLIVVLVLLCGLLIALLPTLASTNWGCKQVTHWINRSIPGNVEIRNLDLHWGKGQVLEGILLKDPEGQAVLGIERFSTEATLWQLLRKSIHLGFTQIQDLNAAVVTDDKGWTNLQRALGIPPSNDTPPLSPSTIVLSNVNADLYLFAANHPLSAQVKGLTRQENLNGSFDINLFLNGLQASDWKELRHDAENYLSIEGSKEAYVQARIVNFPVDLIDRLTALTTPHLNGLFHSILGDRLNLTLDKEASQEGLAFNLTVLAPLMQGDVKGKVVNGILTLQEPAVFHFNLSPEFVNPFTHYQFELFSPSRLKVVFPLFTFPLSFLDDQATIDPCQLGFKAELKLAETEMDISQIGKINIRNLQALVDSSLCDKNVQLQIFGQAQQGKESFDIHFDSTFNKPKNLSYLLRQLHQNLQASLKISHLPLQLIPFLQAHPEWIEQIGPYANAEVFLNPKGKEEWDATLSLQTPRLVLKEAQFRIGKEIILKTPTQLEWQGTVDCLSTLLKSHEFTLDQPCSLQFNLKQFQLPLDHPEFVSYQVESVLPQLQFSKLLSWGTAHAQDLTLKIEGQNLNQFNSQLKGQLTLLTFEGVNSPLLKDPLQFVQTSNWKIGSDGQIDMPVGQFQLNNSITHAQVEGFLTSNHELKLTQPAQFQYILTPLALQTLSEMLGKELPKLQEETSLRLTIDPTLFNLKSLTLPHLNLNGMLAINHLALKDATGALPVLENIVIPWVIDGRSNNFYVDVKGSAYSQKHAKPSQISAHFQLWPTLGHFDIAQTKAEIVMNFAGMPTSILNLLLKTPDMSPILGPILDLNLKAFIDPSKEKPGYWDLTLDSSQFHIFGRFKLEDIATPFDLNKPPTIRLTVTPESYQYLKEIFGIKNDRKLTSPFTFLGILSKFSIPLKDSLSDHSQFAFQFSTTDIQWQDAAIPPIKVEGQMSSQNLMDEIQFSAQVSSSSPYLLLQGTLIHAFDREYQLRNWHEMGLKAALQGKQLISELLEGLFLTHHEQAQKLRAFFGESFEADIDCQVQNLKGTIQASIKGLEGEIHLDGDIKQGILTLNHPLEGSVKMTPLLSQAFIAENLPILSTAIESENPITFSIDPDQFSCPLIPYQLEQVKIGKGTLNLGKIRFRNDGELSSLLSLIRSLSDPILTIWFTPLYFDLDHGILSLKRIDLLVANNYTLASWGNIHLINHQADLVIGLTAQTLHYAFGIQGLNEDYMLQIPLHSAEGKIKIDKKKATARISALLAQTRGGSTVRVLGNLLDRALSHDSEASPPPTTQPFPWKGEFSTLSPATPQPASAENSSDASSQIQENQEKKKKKKRKHQELDSAIPLKDLEEGAIQVLDRLFGQ